MTRANPSALFAGAWLRKAGFEDIRIIDKAGDFGGMAEKDLVQDGWTDIFRSLQTILAGGGNQGSTSEDHALAMEIADFRKMEQVRARAAAIVRDARTAESIKPWYRQFCKRPCFNDEYLATFNRPNVTLVDTQGRGVDRITARGVVVDTSQGAAASRRAGAN